MTTQNRKVLAEYKLNFAEWGGKNLKVEDFDFQNPYGRPAFTLRIIQFPLQRSAAVG